VKPKVNNKGMNKLRIIPPTPNTIAHTFLFLEKKYNITPEIPEINPKMISERIKYILNISISIKRNANKSTIENTILPIPNLKLHFPKSLFSNTITTNFNNKRII
jgi:hypothetical protein